MLGLILVLVELDPAQSGFEWVQVGVLATRESEVDIGLCMTDTVRERRRHKCRETETIAYRSEGRNSTPHTSGQEVQTDLERGC